MSVQTAGAAYPSPLFMQQAWSSVRKRRYRRSWDGREPVGQLLLWWSDPFTITCGNCERGLGRYVAYHAGREFGLLEDTARSYSPAWNFPRRRPSGDPHVRLAPGPRRFRLSGNISKASTTIAKFRCSGCHRIYERNLRTIGKGLFENPQATYSLT